MLIHHEFQRHDISNFDKLFISEFVHGTLRWQGKLEWILNQFYQGNFMKIKILYKNIMSWLAHYHLKKAVIILFWLFIFMLLMDNIVMPIYVRLGQEYEIPNVTELTYNDAEMTLKKHGFKIVLEVQRYDSRFPAGYVISQNPKAFTRVKKGRRIYVVTSMGERYVKVPVLVGNGERNARFMIQSAGLLLDHISYEHSSYYPEGVVSEQSIQPDREVKLGTIINIIISLGPYPDRFLVPVLVGIDLDVAVKRLQKAGLKLGSVTYQIEDKLLPNTVIFQSIEAAAEVNVGEIVELVVSTLPEENIEATIDTFRYR